MRRCNPTAIIIPSKQRTETRYRNGSTADIMRVIADADRQADAHIDPDGVQCLVGRNDYETARNVWTFVKRNVRYRADRPGLEVVKSPRALITSGVGDCKSFSITEAAILRALGFRNIRYRFASYAPGDFTHVYVVARIGGRDVVMDAVHTKFDDEVPYYRKRDIPAAKAIGVAGIRGDISNTFNLVALGLGAFLIYQLLAD